MELSFRRSFYGVVTAATTVTITASADADSGVTSGSLEITVNPHTFKITYNSNDGSAQPAAAPNMPYTYGDGSQSLRTIATLNWTKAGHAFRGWTFAAENENINAALHDGASITELNSNAAAKQPNGTVNLYAKWEIPVYVFTIHDAAAWKEAMDTVNSEGSGTAEHEKQYLFTITDDFELPACSPSGPNPTITAQYIAVRLTAATPKTIAFSTERGHILAISDNQKITIHNIKLKYNTNENAGNTRAFVSIKDSTGSGSAELVMEAAHVYLETKTLMLIRKRLEAGSI
ncbi:MAG: hypothetical protein LBD20_08880 [Spirochaetaceae bacterium]|nr:hypothetical protein [Spirochaetaceae bacterium]